MRYGWSVSACSHAHRWCTEHTRRRHENTNRTATHWNSWWTNRTTHRCAPRPILCDGHRARNTIFTLLMWHVRSDFSSRCVCAMREATRVCQCKNFLPLSQVGDRQKLIFGRILRPRWIDAMHRIIISIVIRIDMRPESEDEWRTAVVSFRLAHFHLHALQPDSQRVAVALKKCWRDSSSTPSELRNCCKLLTHPHTIQFSFTFIAVFYPRCFAIHIMHSTARFLVNFISSFLFVSIA